MARIECRYSRYRPDSVLSEINRVAGSGGTVVLDDETAALIDYAYACYRKSGGLFDITTGILRRAWNFPADILPEAEAVGRLLPLVGLNKVGWERPRLSFSVPGMELDLGGIGKEYAADRAAAICALGGISRGLIDLGGDLHAIGPQSDGTPWSVHLRHPREAGASVAVIPLVRGGLATSGDYERCVLINGCRHSHILDPRTGWPVQGLASVTVRAESCLIAGSLATMAMLKGKVGAEWLREIGVSATWVDTAGNIGGNLGQTEPPQTV